MKDPSLPSRIWTPPGAISRRTFLIYSGAAVSAYSLSGCGGGGGDAGTINVVRPEPSGDISSQLNQYSRAIATLSGSFQGSSAAFGRLTNFNATRSRADSAPTEAYFSGMMLGLDACKEIYERCANVAVALDDATYLGDRVSSTNSLSGPSSLQNPQWAGAMMDRNVDAMTFYGGVMQMMQTGLIAECVAAIGTPVADQDKMIRYGWFVILFNRWVGRVAKLANQPVNPGWVLADVEGMSWAQAQVELARIPAIVQALPFGPGPRSAMTGRADGVDLGTGLSASGSFVGAVGELFIPSGTAAEIWAENPTLAREVVKLNLTSLSGLGQLAKGFVKGFGTDYVVGKGADYLQEAIGGVNGAIAGCAVRVAKGIFDVSTSVAAMCATSVTIVGGVVYGAKLVLDAAQLYMSLDQCVNDYFDAKNKECVTIAGSDLDSSYTPGGSTPPARDVQNNPPPRDLECDQLSNRNLKRKKPCLTREKFPDIDDWKAITPQDARGSLSGQGAGRSVGSRTYNQVTNAAAGLMRDYCGRNASDTGYQVDNDGMEVIISDFALLVRREQGSTSTPAPALTSANMLCTGVGSIPKRNAGPMNLAAMPQWPTLRVLSQLGNGATIDVS
jgi:hypothetical protein